MNLNQAIFMVVIVTLAALGFSTLIGYVWDKCVEFCKLLREMGVFFRSRKQGSHIIEIKVKPSSTMLKRREVKPQPRRMPEVVTESADVYIETEEVAIDEVEPERVTHEEEEADESLFLSINFQGESYSSTHSITVDDLEHMAETLAAKSPSIKDEARAADTMLKLKDSPMMELISAATGDKVKKLVDSVVNNAPKIKKEGYDYSKYITTEL